MAEHSRVAEQVASQGFAHIPGFLSGIPSYDAFEYLGVIDVVEGLHQVQTLRPLSIDGAPPNTYSGNFGMGEFPLHTDLAHWAAPPRFVALRCVHGTDSVRTRLLDGRDLTQSIGLETLRRTLVQPRRPLRNGKQLLQILQRVSESDTYVLRWDPLYLRPATLRGQHAFDSITQYIAGARSREVVLLNVGDTLLLDNWRMLHGRSAISARGKSRQIDRSYLRELR